MNVFVVCSKIRPNVLDTKREDKKLEKIYKKLSGSAFNPQHKKQLLSQSILSSTKLNRLFNPFSLAVFQKMNSWRAFRKVSRKCRSIWGRIFLRIEHWVLIHSINIFIPANKFSSCSIRSQKLTSKLLKIQEQRLPLGMVPLINFKSILKSLYIY